MSYTPPSSVVQFLTDQQHYRISRAKKLGNVAFDVSHETVEGGPSEIRRKFTATFGKLALYKDDEDDEPPTNGGSGGGGGGGGGGASSFISGYTTPGPSERAASNRKKANLGVLLGVYLPTIQHILGVTMFIRLFWVVGMAGLLWTSALLALCCTCTLLTSISLSAVATNGVVESGGVYFMISRNLGVEFGSAVGILFYLANTVAASMYLVGGVEVMLLYLFPEMTIGGEDAHHSTGMMGMMSHNYRIYGTAFLLLEVLIVAMGVKFVQLMAPVSLVCVLLAISACFAGGVEKAIFDNGQRVCMMDDKLLPSSVLFRDTDFSNVSTSMDFCSFCTKNHALREAFCSKDNPDAKDPEAALECTGFATAKLRCINGFPGYNASILYSNMYENFLREGEAAKGKPGIERLDIVQDVTTSFVVLLAIYFPAVTGIMTGTNMSGDLRDPQRSIPRGTIAATLSTSFIYYALAFTFGAAVDRAVLADKNGRSVGGSMVVAILAWPSPWVVTAGAFLSTFGAALQCLCSAPRLLQSIAKDNVIPILSPFARVTKNNEPFLGLLLTAFISELAILLGAVDAIAEVVDFFFLMCYAFVNMICALHSLLKAPNWRPRFRYYHWSLSLMGAFLCFFIMFASQWVYALVVCALTFAIYKYVEWKGAKKEWGDGIRGLALTTAQYSLLKVEDKELHPKNWRPQLLVLIKAVWARHLTDNRATSLLNLASQLKAGRGLAIAVSFLPAGADTTRDKQLTREVKRRLVKEMGATKLRGFAKTLVYNEEQVQGTVSALYQSIGMGGLSPNTVLLNWPELAQPADLELFGEQLAQAMEHENCLLVARGITEFPDANTDRLHGNIDIWWIVLDGGMLMLIAFLLKQHKVWRGCGLRVFAICDSVDRTVDELRADLQRLIYALRIDAQLFIVDLIDQEVSDEEAVQRTIESRRRLRDANANNAFVNGAFANDTYYTSTTTSGTMDDTITSGLRNAGRTSNGGTITRLRVSGGDEDETSFINSRLDSHFKLVESESGRDMTDRQRIMVRKMNTSLLLNRVIRENSPDSQLVLLSLPKPPRSRRELLNDYMTHIDVLTEGLARVLLVAGSGKEVITEKS